MIGEKMQQRNKAKGKQS